MLVASLILLIQLDTSYMIISKYIMKKILIKFKTPNYINK